MTYASRYIFENHGFCRPGKCESSNRNFIQKHSEGQVSKMMIV
jgi:hypothetical protein